MIRVSESGENEPRSSKGAAAEAGLLLIDIGNSHVGMATWVSGKRGTAVHLPNDPIEPVVGRLVGLWNGLPTSGPRVAVVSSVCPPMMKRLEPMCEARGIGSILLIGRDIDPPIRADVREPDKVGTDRLCNAAAAFAKLRQACVVADFGTAVTIDLVADNNYFMGGTIMPGIALAARALHEHTAQLPLVEVGTPTGTIGKDTVEAIRNGIFAMMVGALRETTERLATEIGKWPPLIVTGGNARDIAGGCDFVDHVLPDLCLDGLVIAYLNAAARCDQGHEQA
ncbi:MAG TPA: type III pantothenate kinase [Phycisphaerae bacterium]|nr:type III pantothenate kinase [Phycisphaerae bacterium]HRY68305.1 type III pantothenate kinase [Phycisphaerae bacterium]HSA26812.1 type III pantothenate kinase [Phycisphaerae bacterium]